MRIIGLCGRSGSGKGVFSQVAADNGFYIIDCDKIYHQLTTNPTKCLVELKEYFGEEIADNNALNRKKLAQIVFSDKSKLNKLNEITHKHILDEINNIIKSISDENAIVLIDAPTLFESGVDKLCDAIVVITAPEEKCINRISIRDNITIDQAKSRLNNQLSIDYLISKSNYHINNNSTVESMYKNCQIVIDKIRGAVL